MRIKVEIKMLYKKKQHLNTVLYELHLQNSKQWKTWWLHIEHNINIKLQSKKEEKIFNAKQENRHPC
jgi:hypothetical protein